MSSATPAALSLAMSMMTTSARLLLGDDAGRGLPDVAGAAYDGDFALHALWLSSECGRCTPYMLAMMASANCDVFSSVAPSIWRARS